MLPMVTEAVEWLPRQPDPGLALPNFSKKKPQKQEGSKLLQEVRREQGRAAFPLALLEQVLAGTKAGSSIKGRCENVPALTWQ